MKIYKTTVYKTRVTSNRDLSRIKSVEDFKKAFKRKLLDQELMDFGISEFLDKIHEIGFERGAPPRTEGVSHAERMALMPRNVDAVARLTEEEVKLLAEELDEVFEKAKRLRLDYYRRQAAA